MGFDISILLLYYLVISFYVVKFVFTAVFQDCWSARICSMFSFQIVPILCNMHLVRYRSHFEMPASLPAATTLTQGADD
jgi:hypothetical protein